MWCVNYSGLLPRGFHTTPSCVLSGSWTIMGWGVHFPKVKSGKCVSHHHGNTSQTKFRSLRSVVRHREAFWEQLLRSNVGWEGGKPWWRNMSETEKTVTDVVKERVTHTSYVISMKVQEGLLGWSLRCWAWLISKGLLIHKDLTSTLQWLAAGDTPIRSLNCSIVSNHSMPRFTTAEEQQVRVLNPRISSFKLTFLVLQNTFCSPIHSFSLSLYFCCA